jgi:hypothetical protein
LKFLYKNIVYKLINVEKRKIENGCHCDPDLSGDEKVLPQRARRSTKGRKIIFCKGMGAFVR